MRKNGLGKLIGYPRECQRKSFITSNSNLSIKESQSIDVIFKKKAVWFTRASQKVSVLGFLQPKIIIIFYYLA